MKDIDFDELDRAVSSVLNKKDSPADPPPAGESAGTVIAVSSSASTMAPKEPQAQTQASPSPAAVNARRGRFMDVVHPASPAAAPTLTKHEAPALDAPAVAEPTPAAETPSAPDPTVTPPPSEEAEQPTEPTAVVDEAGALLGAQPAPVAVPEPGTSTEETSSPEAEAVTSETVTTPAEDPAPAPQPEAAVPDTDGDGMTDSEEAAAPPTTLATTVPQTSPFLADTKVEKRPLGGPADAPADPSESASSASPVTLPRELESDVRFVEIAQSEQEQAIASGSPFAATVPVASEPTEDGRVEGHPLFDTTTYHEPIIDVSHKGMPGWLKWILGLAACLVLGAGVGYFLFTAGL